MKKRIALPLMLFIAMGLYVQAGTELSIKLHFFGSSVVEGKPQVTTAFYLKSVTQRNLQVAFDSAAMRAELQKTFHLPNLALLSSGDMSWNSGDGRPAMQFIRINGLEYAVVLTPLPRPGAVNFKVGVVEENHQSIKNVLLDTEIVLPDREVALLGFSDSRDNSYFIAFYVQNRTDAPAESLPRLSAAERPKLIKEVKPVYPDVARKALVQGVVVLEAHIDKAGKVKDLEVVSGHPLFNQAAMDAVRQWEYVPYMPDGTPREVAFTVTVTFRLDPKETKRPPESGNASTLRLLTEERPKRVREVVPIYPAEAMKQRLQGVVVVEAQIDHQGMVKDAKVLASPAECLSTAALTAVRQWRYEPYKRNGVPKEVIFTVTVTFSLAKDKNPEKKTP